MHDDSVTASAKPVYVSDSIGFEDDDEEADQYNNYNPDRKSRGSSYFAKGGQNFKGKKVTANNDFDNMSEVGGSVYAKNQNFVSKKPVVGAGVVKINSSGGIDSDDDGDLQNDRRITRVINNAVFEDNEGSDDEAYKYVNNAGKKVNHNRRNSDDSN